MTRRPWRAATRVAEMEGRHNAHNRGYRTAHWWELELDCGHTVERTRRSTNTAPRKVRCDWCPKEES